MVSFFTSPHVVLNTSCHASILTSLAAYYLFTFSFFTLFSFPTAAAHQAYFDPNVALNAKRGMQPFFRPWFSVQAV
jgi:hypothetical protein